MPHPLLISATISQLLKSAPLPPPIDTPLKLVIATKKMPVTQAYLLAYKARAKLSSEATRPDRNLRRLVGHANLLDLLMLELAEAEREQRSGFNQTTRGSTSPKREDRHTQWADAIVEEPDSDWQAEDAESDLFGDVGDFSEKDDVEGTDIFSFRRIPSHTVSNFSVGDMDEGEGNYENGENEGFP